MLTSVSTRAGMLTGPYGRSQESVGIAIDLVLLFLSLQSVTHYVVAKSFRVVAVVTHAVVTRVRGRDVSRSAVGAGDYWSLHS